MSEPTPMLTLAQTHPFIVLLAIIGATFLGLLLVFVTIALIDPSNGRLDLYSALPFARERRRRSYNAQPWANDLPPLPDPPPPSPAPAETSGPGANNRASQASRRFGIDEYGRIHEQAGPPAVNHDPRRRRSRIRIDEYGRILED